MILSDGEKAIISYSYMDLVNLRTAILQAILCIKRSKNPDNEHTNIIRAEYNLLQFANNLGFTIATSKDDIDLIIDSMDKILNPPPPPVVPKTEEKI